MQLSNFPKTLLIVPVDLVIMESLELKGSSLDLPKKVSHSFLWLLQEIVLFLRLFSLLQSAQSLIAKCVPLELIASSASNLIIFKWSSALVHVILVFTNMTETVSYSVLILHTPSESHINA